MKTGFSGEVLSIQPRIRLSRSYDTRQHVYLGYALTIRGTLDGEARSFSVGIGPGAHSKLSFRAGDIVEGQAEPVADPRSEPVDLYKAVKLNMISRGLEAPRHASPPWVGVPPPLETYRSRGHRRLDEKSYAAPPCRVCVWGCRMPVELIIDPWKPNVRDYRFETFCYGPKSCPAYVAGRPRKVPGRNNTSWTEEDWVDEDATSHRGPDE